MTLTPEQLRQTADAIEAFNRGDEVQVFNCGQWMACRFQVVDDFNLQWLYRPKPAPQTRPWSKPEDVPGPVCWLRSDPLSAHWMVICACGIGIHITPSAAVNPIKSWSELESWQYSTDRKEWHKCEVTEE